MARSEVERRTNYIELLHKQLGDWHPLSQLVSQCLHNIPAQRPSAEGVLQQLEAVRRQGAYGSLKMEMTKLQVAMMSMLRTETEVGEKKRTAALLQTYVIEVFSCNRSTEKGCR